MLDIAQKIFSIVVVDLVLSGDNAVVIGMAARNLSPVHRHKAIVWGGVGAIALRVTFTVLAALLLEVPLIQAIGGLLLIYIAWKLIAPEKPEDEAAEDHVKASGSLSGAIRTIILADAVMSIDNILAVGGAAEGELWLLLFGLGLSIPILLFGSNIVARVLQNHPSLLIIGVLVLVHSAVSMVMDDDWVGEHLHIAAPEWEVLLVSAAVAVILLGSVRAIYGSFAGVTGPQQT